MFDSIIFNVFNQGQFGAFCSENTLVDGFHDELCCKFNSFQCLPSFDTFYFNLSNSLMSDFYYLFKHQVKFIFVERCRQMLSLITPNLICRLKKYWLSEEFSDNTSHFLRFVYELVFWNIEFVNDLGIIDTQIWPYAHKTQYKRRKILLIRKFTIKDFFNNLRLFSLRFFEALHYM